MGRKKRNMAGPRPLLLTMSKVILPNSARLDTEYAMQDQKEQKMELESKNKFSLGMSLTSPVPICRIFASGQYHVLVGEGHHNKIPHTGWIKQQTFISHTLGTKIKVSAGCDSSEASLLGCRWLPSLCVFTMPFLCVYASFVPLSLLIKIPTILD